MKRRKEKGRTKEDEVVQNEGGEALDEGKKMEREEGKKKRVEKG